MVSTLSAYERGKRSLSLERLYELAAIYGQSPMSILDMEDDPEFQRTLSTARPCASASTSWTGSPPRSGGRWRPTWPSCGSCATIRRSELLTIRKDDLAYLSGLYGVRPQALKDYLEKEGILLTH